MDDDSDHDMKMCLRGRLALTRTAIGPEQGSWTMMCGVANHLQPLHSSGFAHLVLTLTL